MLISFTRRFVFIAATKNASTTIEHVLRPHSDIALTHPRFGKHLQYRKVATRFHFLFDRYGVPIESFFRFGVIREPLEWVVSWYNYRSRERLATTRNPAKAANSARGATFEEFVEELMVPEGRRQFARIGSQVIPFMTREGGLGVDYLIPLRRVNTELPQIGRALGVETPLAPEIQALNVSPSILSVKQVPGDLARKVREHLSVECELFSRAEAGGFGNVTEVVERKLREAMKQQRGHGRKRKRAAENEADDAD
jgi:hypothetical protein